MTPVVGDATERAFLARLDARLRPVLPDSRPFWLWHALDLAAQLRRLVLLRHDRAAAATAAIDAHILEILESGAGPERIAEDLAGLPHDEALDRALLEFWLTHFWTDFHPWVREALAKSLTAALRLNDGQRVRGASAGAPAQVG